MSPGPNSIPSTVLWILPFLLAGCGGDAFTQTEGSAGGADASAGTGGSDTGGASGTGDSDTGGTGGVAGADTGGTGGIGGSGTGGTGSDCTPEQKLCEGECVALDNPAFGCDATTCEPCDLEHVETHTCTNLGCSVGECVDGWGDCDEDPDSGCENPLDADDNCGSCSNVCTDPENGTSTCDGGVCDVVCENTHTFCTDTCELVGTDVAHCLGCDKPCEPVPNATLGCSNGECSFTCNNGYTECNSACVSLFSDNKNCGWCGHDCEGTSCSDGACAGKVLNTAVGNLVTLAVDPGPGDAGEVFWAENGNQNTVKRRSKAPSPVTISYTSTPPIKSMVVDPTFLFVGTLNKGLVRKNRTAGMEAFLTPTGDPMDMQQNGTVIGWAQTADSGIFLADKATVDITKPVEFASTSFQPRFPQLEPGTETLYYAGIGKDSANMTSYIAKHSSESVTVETIVGNLPPIGGLAMNADSLFWTLPSVGEVQTTTKENVSANVIAQNIPKVEAIAVDGAFVVWAQNIDTSGGGQIVGQYGTENRKLAAGELSVCALALDNDYVYWINCRSAGDVKRVRR